MSIVTFYSYKGGVGRTMALANVAVLLGRKGYRVLAVDWDLEAPGIERYFADLRIESDAPGLLTLLIEAAKRERPDYERYTWRVEDPNGGLALKLLHAGREADPDYYQNLERFEWPRFFANGGGDYLEDLRERWLSDFDFVLVDSRTGLSDAGGVCTIQMPDIVVAMFTPAYQSLFGARDVMRLAQAARQRLAYDRPALSVLPVPSRVDRKQPSYAEWRARFASEMAEFCSEWLPRGADRAEVLDRLAVAHEPAVFHGERLAVLSGTGDSTIGTAYDRLATLLASDLEDLSPVMPVAKKRAVVKKRSAVNPPPSAASPRVPMDYEFDIYVSYRRTEMVTRWLRELLVPMLKDALDAESEHPSRIFMDSAEIEIGDRWVEKQREALVRSRMLLAVWTPSYFSSAWCLAELETFRLRSKALGPGAPLFVPIVFSGHKQVPEAYRQYYILDLSRYTYSGKAFKETEEYYEFQRAIRQLGRDLAERLRLVPPLDPDWPVVEPDMVRPVQPPSPPLPRF